MKLHTREQRDEALRDHIETVHYLDEQTGEFYEPPEPPKVNDPEGDEDAEVTHGPVSADTPPSAHGAGARHERAQNSNTGLSWQLPRDQLPLDREEER